MTLRTTYEQATAGYDADYEDGLTDALLRAIADASKVSDIDAPVLRTGEAASALLSCLAVVLAMSPSAARSPTAMRQTVDTLGKRLRARVVEAQRDPGVQEFLRRAFHGTGTDGTA
jgi:hypothetical protein